MRAVVQRVLESSVQIEDKIVGKIGKGYMVLLGVSENDGEADLKYMTDKVINLRIFEDAEGKMNLSLKDVGGELLVVSQFTLYGDCRRGRRPSFIAAARPDLANQLYEQFVQVCRNEGIRTETGVFQADMKVNIVNDGPVTLILDSEKIL